MAASATEPERIERVGDRSLRISWGDGHDSLYAWDFLRASCPCAMCSAQARGDASSSVSHRETPPAESDARPVEIKPVGRYALAIRWSDGHATGIFSHEYLRSICPCEACKPNQMTEG